MADGGARKKTTKTKDGEQNKSKSDQNEKLQSKMKDLSVAEGEDNDKDKEPGTSKDDTEGSGDGTNEDEGSEEDEEADTSKDDNEGSGDGTNEDEGSEEDEEADTSKDDNERPGDGTIERSCQRAEIKIGTEIYRIWKAHLKDWLSLQGCKVYLTTPFLDKKRAADVYEILEGLECKGQIKAFFVRNKCYTNTITKVSYDIKNIIQYLKTRFGGSEEEIKSNMNFCNEITGLQRKFHAKFIGCTKENGDAEVLITSANFTDQHFDSDKFTNTESVVKLKTSKEDFLKSFIQPLRKITKRF